MSKWTSEVQPTHVLASTGWLVPSPSLVTIIPAIEHDAGDNSSRNPREHQLVVRLLTA
jgi:hypothetical protein